ncbi:MAG: FHA domain-containing protein, partial [Anaerovoracaceae bacterium]
MDLLNTVLEYTGIYFTTGVRWVFLVLAIFILARQIRSLLQARNPSEIWAYLGCPDGTNVPLTHWENLIGRGRGCDVIINLTSVSRSHATLIRDSAGVWKYNDLNSKNGSRINGRPVKEATVLKGGDVLTIGGSDFTLYPVSLQERMANIEKRKRKTRPVSPWPSLAALTLFQLLTVIQFRISLGEDFPANLPIAFALLCALMWFYVIFMRTMRRVGFEMEIIAFFLSTLSLAVTASAYPSTVFKQAVCVVLGLALFFGLCWFLRDLNRAKRIIYALMGASVLLLLINLLLGTVRYGAQNWVEIGGFSFQPSELVKIVFVYVGAATLDEL